jgi:hypothetical protein
MVTIHHLEVHLEIEGEGDEAVFSRLFDKHIGKWHKLAEEAKLRQCRADDYRSLGDRPQQDGGQ